MPLLRPRHILFSLCLVPVIAAGQGAIPTDQPSVKRALDEIKSTNSWTLDQQVSICEIPAPDFKEQARAAEFKKRLIALGYPGTRIDTAGNVIAERPGTGNGPTVMLAGHLDTVFPEGTDVKVKRDGNKFAAPGIGDDCRGLAVVLAVAKALNQGQIKTTGKVILVGNVGEEGEGNLRGVRELLTNGYKGKIDYFISVDGLGLHVFSTAPWEASVTTSSSRDPGIAQLRCCPECRVRDSRHGTRDRVDLRRAGTGEPEDDIYGRRGERRHIGELDCG